MRLPAPRFVEARYGELSRVALRDGRNREERLEAALTMLRRAVVRERRAPSGIRSQAVLTALHVADVLVPRDEADDWSAG